MTRYVTFEGNGRREAFKRAFDSMPEIEVLVEVRLYQFEDAETLQYIRQQVELCREWKKVSHL